MIQFNGHFANPELLLNGADETLRIDTSLSALYDTHSAIDPETGEEHCWDGEGKLAGWSRFQDESHKKGRLPAPARAHWVVQEFLATNEAARDPLRKPLVRVNVRSQFRYKPAARFITALQRDFGAHYDKGFRQISYRAGQSPISVIRGAHLFLTTDPRLAYEAIKAGVSAAQVLDSRFPLSIFGQPLRPSLDADAVLVSDEGEVEFDRALKEGDPDNAVRIFNEFEQAKAAAGESLPPGPFDRFFFQLCGLLSMFRDVPPEEWPIHPQITTARGPATQERIHMTLDRRGVIEYLIGGVEHMSGEEKGPRLVETGAHIHVDDGLGHGQSSLRYGIAAAQVVYGVKNQKLIDEYEGGIVPISASKK